MSKRKKTINSNFNRSEVWAVLLFISAIVILLSIIGYVPGEVRSGTDNPEHFLKDLGVIITEFLVLKTMGYFSIVFPIIMIVFSYAIFFKKDLKYYIIKSIHLFAIALSIASLFYSKTVIVGPILTLMGTYLNELLGPVLFYILLPLCTITLIASFINIALYDLFMIAMDGLRFLFDILSKIFSFLTKYIRLGITKFKNYKANKKLKIEVANPEKNINDKSEFINREDKIPDDEPSSIDVKEAEDELVNTDSEKNDNEIDNMDNENSVSIMIEDEVEVEQGNLDKHESRKHKYRNYKLPLTEYLVEPVEISNTIDENLLREKAQELVHALETFGVKSKVRKYLPVL